MQMNLKNACSHQLMAKGKLFFHSVFGFAQGITVAPHQTLRFSTLSMSKDGRVEGWKGQIVKHYNFKPADNHSLNNQLLVL